MTRVEVRAGGDNLSTWGHWPPLWSFEFNLAKAPAATAAVFAARFARLTPAFSAHGADIERRSRR